jgi:hypothetical protein
MMLEALGGGRTREAARLARQLAFTDAPAWAPLYENLAARYADASGHEEEAVELPETNLAPQSG